MKKSTREEAVENEKGHRREQKVTSTTAIGGKFLAP
jgi:hypothetical protein